VSRLEALLDELSSVPPRDFTRERAALVARLTGEGRTDEAKKVKALRAPPMPLWAANRLARERPELVRRLAAAAERVRDAQLGRAATGDLAPAIVEHREAVEALVRALDPVLADAHVTASPPMRERTRNTLMAAAADPELRKRLLTGRLEEELGAPGFDLFAGATPVHRAPAGRSVETPSRTETPKAPSPPTSHERRAAEREERQRRAAETRAAEAREREAAAERLRPLREAVARASQELDDARSEVRRAAEAVTAATQRKRDAEQALRAAERRRP
jgi:hypothetical protein